MYKWFQVKNYRCFGDLKITRLQRVNLVAGKNNAGKSSLLEALFMHCGGPNPLLALQISGMRGMEKVRIEFGATRETPWDSLFRDFDASRPIELLGETEQEGPRMVRVELVTQAQRVARFGATVSGGTTQAQPTVLEVPVSADVFRSLRFWGMGPDGEETKCDLVAVPGAEPHFEPTPPAPAFPGHLIGARGRASTEVDGQMFSQLGKEGLERVLVEPLSVLEPRLTGLRLFDHHGQTVIHGDIGLSRSIPLPFIGEGMARLASLLLRVWAAGGGVVLVDEIENGFHHSVLGQVWAAIGKVARGSKTQVFATTHSWECIVAAQQAFSEGEEYDFCLHRLDRIDGQIQDVTYDRETLDAAIETGLEVR